MTITLRIENFDQLPDGGPVQYQTSRRGFEIGREQHLDWTLPDPNRVISGRHCEVRYEKGGYWLFDVSRNGTFLNSGGARMKSPHQLQSGDRLQIGHYLVSVSIQEAAFDDAADAPLSGASMSSAAVVDSIWDLGGSTPAPVDRRSFMPEAKRGQRAPDFSEQYVDLPDMRPRPAPSGSPFGQPQHLPFGQPAQQSPFGQPAQQSPFGQPQQSPYGQPQQPSPFGHPAQPLPFGQPAQTPFGQPAQASPFGQPAQQQPFGQPPARPFDESPFGAPQQVAPPQPRPEPAPLPGPPAGFGQSGQGFRSAEAAPPVQQHHSIPPVSMPPVSMPPAGLPPLSMPPVTPLAAHSGTSATALRAFADGAGLPPGIFDHRDADEVAHEIGRVMRIVMEQLAVLLKARAAAKVMTKSSNRTMVSAEGNNPLKFIPGAPEVLEVMFARRRAGYLDAERSVEEAFADLKSHELATFAAMQKALARLLEGLSPQSIEQKLPSSAFSSKKARAWDVFVERWDSKTDPYENGMLDVFLAYFAEAYDEAVRKR